MLAASQCEKDGHLRAFGNGLILTRLDRRGLTVDKHSDKPLKPAVLIEEMTAKACGLSGEGLERLTHCRRLNRSARIPTDELTESRRHDNGHETQRGDL